MGGRREVFTFLRTEGRFPSPSRHGVRGWTSRQERLSVRTTKISPPLLFGRLWRLLGLVYLLTGLLRNRKFEFAVERAIFLFAPHRLVAPFGDRATEEWMSDHSTAGAEQLSLHHLYRAVAWLGEPLPKTQQSAGARGPRAIKVPVEEELFLRDRRHELDAGCGAAAAAIPGGPGVCGGRYRDD